MLVMGYLLYDYAQSMANCHGRNHTVINPSGEKFTGMLSGRLMCRHVPKEQPRKVPKKCGLITVPQRIQGWAIHPRLALHGRLSTGHMALQLSGKTKSPGPCTLIRGGPGP